MARGGQRNPTPGKSYTNRSDMRTTQPVTTVPGQAYGEAKQQADAQHAIPLQNGAGLNTAPGAQDPNTPPQPSTLVGGLGSLFDPTTRPGEPVTHGAASGPGGGPEVLGNPQDNVRAQLSALYLAHPNPDLRDLLETFDINQGNI